MAEVVLDANVVVAMLDAHDVHATRARDLVAHLSGGGMRPSCSTSSSQRPSLSSLDAPRSERQIAPTSTP
jgi:hypothetical protein